MKSPRRQIQKSGASIGQSVLLGFEKLEDRRVLAADADIIFIVDESLSDDTASAQSWLGSIIEDLDNTLQTSGVNTRYGLVGFGENDGPEYRYSHSQLLDGELFSEDFNDLIFAIENNLQNEGGDEDGWDAIEHAIAEYDFRDGAVPIVILVQNDEGRVHHIDNNLSSTTRDGVLAALKSKNVILNSMVVGDTVDNPPIYDVEPLFDLAPYGISPDIRVLGVEADSADGVFDGRHNYHWIDTDTINSTVDTINETTSEALQVSYNGSNTGATGMVKSELAIAAKAFPRNSNRF